MYGNSCESDCRSRGREFNPGRVPYFHGDYEIISTVILLPYAESFKKDCCQLQAKVCAQSTACSSLPRKKVRLGEQIRPAMTIAVDFGHKATKQTNK